MRGYCVLSCILLTLCPVRSQNVPATYHQSMSDSTDIVHAHTPRSSPYQIVSLSPTLPSSSPQEPLTSSPYFSHNIEPNPKSPHDENWVEVREGVVPSLKRMRSLSPEDSVGYLQLDDFIVHSILISLSCCMAGNGGIK